MIRSVEKKIEIVSKVMLDFVNEFNGFTNEFQYDWLIANMDIICSPAVISFSGKETMFNFSLVWATGEIDNYFLDCLTNVPFLLESVGFRAVLVHDLHVKFRAAIGDKYEAKPYWYYMTYNEQLKLPEWKQKREEVFAQYGRECSQCGRAEEIHVHHKSYKSKTPPWDYPLENFQVMCKSCHFTHHQLEANGVDLDGELDKLQLPQNAMKRLSEKMHIQQFLIDNFTDNFLILIALDGDTFRIEKNHYQIGIKHLRKRRFVTPDMIRRHIHKLGDDRVTFHDNCWVQIKKIGRTINK